MPGSLHFIEPREPVPADEAERFDCSRPQHRHPRESEGLEYDVTTRGMRQLYGLGRQLLLGVAQQGRYLIHVRRIANPSYIPKLPSYFPTAALP